jgi:hypothetical protein
MVELQANEPRLGRSASIRIAPLSAQKYLTDTAGGFPS